MGNCMCLKPEIPKEKLNSTVPRQGFSARRSPLTSPYFANKPFSNPETTTEIKLSEPKKVQFNPISSTRRIPPTRTSAHPVQKKEEEKNVVMTIL